MVFLTVLLTILKIIGIALAGIIGLILLVLLIVLFSPVSYRGRIKFDGQIDIKLRVRYLFGLVRAYFIKNADGQDMDAKILWHSLLKKKPKRKTSGKRGRKKNAKPRGQDKRPAGTEYFDYEAAAPPDQAQKQLPAQDAPPDEIKQDGGRENKNSQDKKPKEKKSIFKRVKDIYNKITERLKSFFDLRDKLLKEVNDKDNREAVSFMLGIVKKLLKHILPRKHRIYVRFGMDDPAATGEILGAAYAFGALLGLNLVIEPDFEHKVFECDIPFKGRVCLFRVLIWAVRVYTNKKVRALIDKVTVR